MKRDVTATAADKLAEACRALLHCATSPTCAGCVHQGQRSTECGVEFARDALAAYEAERAPAAQPGTTADGPDSRSVLVRKVAHDDDKGSGHDCA